MAAAGADQLVIVRLVIAAAKVGRIVKDIVRGLAVEIEVEISEINLGKFLFQLGKVPAGHFAGLVGKDAVLLFLLLGQTGVAHHIGGFHMELHQSQTAGVSAEDDVVLVHLDGVQRGTLPHTFRTSVHSFRGNDAGIVLIGNQLRHRQFQQFFRNHSAIVLLACG